MKTSGRRLLDSCGEVFVVRGVEQILGNQLPPGNDWVGLVEQIAASGANTVRVLPGVNTLSVDDVDEVLSAVGRHRMVAYLGTLSDDGMWFGRSDVRSMLGKHESYLIIDAYGEPQLDDRERFRSDAKAALKQFRDWGYRVPLTATGNRFGRDLPSVLQYGAEIVAADPLHNTILGWQAYWGSGGYYHEEYGMTFTQAIAAIVAAPFPIQLGLDYITDPPSQTLDYGTLMTETQAHGIGWLWWDWYNPYGSDNNLSRNGTARSLTPTGEQVVNAHPASLVNTAVFACSGSAEPPPPPPPPPTPEPPPVVGSVAINAGGGASGGFEDDRGFSGGNVAPRSTASIDRSLVPAPLPPESVYQTERWGASTYRLAGFAPFSQHVVQLHFAETYFNARGKRKFAVIVNDVQQLSEFDIVAAAGAPNKAIRRDFTTKANVNGEVVIRFARGSVDEPKISGIVIQ